MEPNSTELPAPIRVLDRIFAKVEKLSPPVEAFERGIRTSPFRVLISVLLSARTRDPVTLAASTRLFQLADSPFDMSGLPLPLVEETIFPVGFYRDKARRILETSQILTRNAGHVPRDLDGLMALPGVGRKTANLVLSLAFDVPAIAVDIHVFRISRRLGWASATKPTEVEFELKELFPRKYWNRINQVLVGFGQTLCRPRKPLCGECPVTGNCLWYSKNLRESS